MCARCMRGRFRVASFGAPAFFELDVGPVTAKFTDDDLGCASAGLCGSFGVDQPAKTSVFRAPHAPRAAGLVLLGIGHAPFSMPSLWRSQEVGIGFFRPTAITGISPRAMAS